MVSKFEVFFFYNKMALVPILGDDPDFGGDFSLRGGSAQGAAHLLNKFP